jgi:hypothetical protein
MNALWIDENTNPDYPRLAGRGLTHLFFAERDPRLTSAYLDGVRQHGYTVGIYWASTWNPELDGAGAAVHMNQRWVALGGASKLLHVQFDVEQHDPEYVSGLVTRWRALRPFAKTSWTMEGFQGAWIADIRQQLLAANIVLVPQAYDGNLAPFDTDGVLRDLTAYGFPPDRVTPFHDAAMLYRGWSGFAFTQARLA